MRCTLFGMALLRFLYFFDFYMFLTFLFVLAYHSNVMYLRMVQEKYSAMQISSAYFLKYSGCLLLTILFYSGKHVKLMQ